MRLALKRHYWIVPVFVVLTAGEAFYVQFSAFSCDILAAIKDTTLRRLLIINLASAFLVVFLPRLIGYIALGCQFLISIVVLSYVAALSMPPTMASMINGFNLLSETGLSSFWSYLSKSALFICLPLFMLKCRLLFLLPRFTTKIRIYMTVLLVMLLTILHLDDFRTQRYGLTSLGLKDAFTNLTVNRIQRRGFTAVWLQELISGITGQQKLVYQETGCSPSRIKNLPVPRIGSKITMIQWESLDWIATSKNIDAKLTAPNLNALIEKSIVLRMDGRKILASANSDYEILNSKVCNLDMLYYAYVPGFPDSIIIPFHNAKYETSVIHGLEGSYMQLRQVYPKMGFNNLFFREELNDSGYSANGNLFMGQVPDAKLFEFAAELAKNKDNYLHFLITISTHSYEKELATGDKTWPEYYQMIHYTDKALGQYLDSIPEGNTIIIYGDHQSYDNVERNNIVPFIIYVKGGDLRYEAPETVFSRCEMSHYLKRIFMNLLINGQTN